MEEQDTEQDVTDFLLGIFLPGILTFTSGWLIFRLYLDETLTEAGFPPMGIQDGPGAISAGYGRFILLVGLSVLVTLPIAIVYSRRFKNAGERGSH